MRTRSSFSFVNSLLVLLCGTALPSVIAAAEQPGNSVFHDWSTKHVIYPGSVPPGQQAKMAQDPRWMNQLRKQRGALVVSTGNKSALPQEPLRRDWAVPLTTGSNPLPNSGVAEGVYPAKFSFDTTAPPNCTKDFMVFPINSNASATQANIVAFNQLYRGPTSEPAGYCGTGDPSPMWAYMLGSGRIASSPVLSLDGARVAFVESLPSGGAVFHVLTWKSGQGMVAAPAAADQKVILDGTHPNPMPCAAGVSCDVQIPLGSAVTFSFPFVHYGRNVAWVGDDSGKLHRIRNVFSTSPEYISATDSMIIGASRLTSPVYDPGALRLIVSDAARLYIVDTGTATTPAASWTPTTYTPATPLGEIVDGPVLDLRMPDKKPYYTVAWLFGKNAVFLQLDYAWSPFAISPGYYQDTIGGPSNYPVHAGAFSGGVYLPTFGAGGYLFVCGNQGGASANLPRLYKWNITGEGKVAAGGSKWTNVGTSAGLCSPPTYGYVAPFSVNRTLERVFVGSTGSGGYARMWDVSDQGQFPQRVPDAEIQEPGGTSAIVVDNFVNPATYVHSANIFFGTLSPSASCGGALCAVKLTQANLF